MMLLRGRNIKGIKNINLMLMRPDLWCPCCSHSMLHLLYIISDLIQTGVSLERFFPHTPRLAFCAIVLVAQLQKSNLISGDKVLTPREKNGPSKQGLKYQAAYVIAYRFPCVPNHNRVVAFHIMFIITTVTAH